MPLTNSDRQLLARCIEGQPFAWHSFVDRFISLTMQVIDQLASSRSVEISEKNREELAANFFAEIMRDDFELLRKFEGKCSLANYMTVVAGRVISQLMQERLKSESAEVRWN